MGTSKRYSHVVDQRVSDRVAETIMRSGAPLSLSPAELELDLEPLTRTPVPHSVRAWVRYPDAPLKVDAEAVAWTSRAVAIRWPAPEGEHRAWVWASAVDKVP